MFILLYFCGMFFIGCPPQEDWRPRLWWLRGCEETIICPAVWVSGVAHWTSHQFVPRTRQHSHLRSVLELPIRLMCTSRLWQEAGEPRGRAFSHEGSSLQAWGIEPVTSLLWGHGANRCAAVTPCLCLRICLQEATICDFKG